MSLNGKQFRSWAFGVIAFFALLFGIYAYLMYGSPDRLREQGFVMAKEAVLPSLWYNVLWAHALSAGLALAIGWLQFLKGLRRGGARVHRIIGYVYSFMIVIGGLTGLYLAFYADGGWSGRIGFAALSICWLFTLYHGLKTIIVHRNEAAHRRWMTYNYALTCAAITLRIYTIIASVVGWDDTDVTFIVIAWLCWVPNLLVARLILRRSGTGGRPFSSNGKRLLR
ncbi:DUF2306 domain-containing protein [Paenibacillus sp. NPDC058071]|uniref:DUF2306 domain-containing protein n=1 Tax=Paenibacillus sp. NPDC058071 TaxID=3346326 RepID=UPI0036D92F21